MLKAPLTATGLLLASLPALAQEVSSGGITVQGDYERTIKVIGTVSPDAAVGTLDGLEVGGNFKQNVLIIGDVKTSVSDNATSASVEIGNIGITQTRPDPKPRPTAAPAAPAAPAAAPAASATQTTQSDGFERVDSASSAMLDSTATTTSTSASTTSATASATASTTSVPSSPSAPSIRLREQNARAVPSAPTPPTQPRPRRPAFDANEFLFAQVDVLCKGGTSWRLAVPNANVRLKDVDDDGYTLTYQLKNGDPASFDGAELDCAANGGLGECLVTGNASCTENKQLPVTQAGRK